MKFAFSFSAFAFLALVLPTFARGAEAPPPLRFSRDILPILSENCFQCHGPDEKARKAKLRLDTQAGVLGVLTPRQSEDSKLFLRITAARDLGIMPPVKSGKTLTAAQIETLHRWIDEGAVWGKPWAYETPSRPALPVVKN